MVTEREDNQIGVQEAMAVVLWLFSRLTWLEATAIAIYVDNEGVRYSLISGTSKGKEIALMVARMWHEAAVQRWGLLFRRVESKANLADGPTRDDFSHLQDLGAEWKEPQMPDWFCFLWSLVPVEHLL